METPVNPDREAELAGVVREWDLAMVANDAEAIGRYMAEDWIIIGADGATTGGTYLGQRFHEVELASCVFVRQRGEWRCVLTHLSRLPDPVPP
jgi:ketosteroid isomerase-like protein